MAFLVREPSGAATPLVVEVPHAGLTLDAPALATLVAPAFSVARDADLYVDELFQDAPHEGATLLTAQASRYLVDLNRSEGDVDAMAVEGASGRTTPHGLVWRATTDGRPALAAPLTHRELERRLSTYYRPYHAELARLLESRVARFGFALLLCAHSMPSRGRDGHADTGRARADVVPGSRGRTSADAAVIDTVDRVAREAGFSIAHDQPYRGGFSTAHYGRPERGVHAVQVELSRRLYMNELTLERRAREFPQLREFCRDLVRQLGAVRPHSRAASSAGA